MRKRNFLIFLLLGGLWPVIGLSAQDAWKITAEQINPQSYYGITVANGMLCWEEFMISMVRGE